MVKVQKEIKIKLGRLVTTIGAAGIISSEDMQNALMKHQYGDWGNVPPEDAEANNQAVKEGGRILSSYKNSHGNTFWIITESDRSVTTFLLPDEY